MAVKQAGVTLTDDDLSETDRQVLDVVAQGRVTPQFLADELGISRQYASGRLKRFREHGVVRKPAPGLYEFVRGNDPREDNHDD